MKDFLVGLVMVFVIEGLLLAGAPNWLRRAMQSAMEAPEHILRIVGIVCAVVGLVAVWYLRR